MKKTVLSILLLISFIEAKDFNFISQFSYGIGGDTILHKATNNLKAGEGMVYALGVEFYPLENKELDTTFTVGYSYNGSFLDDNYKVTKIPITLTENYTYNKNWKFGVGVTYHVNHKGDKDKTNLPDLTFDNALGGVFSVGYLYGKNNEAHIALKTTIIDYNINEVTLNGNRFAIIMGQRF